MTALAAGQGIKASLSESLTGKTVLLQFNPQKIGLSHTVGTQEIPADKSTSTPQLGYTAAVNSVGATKLTLTGLIFDGTGAASACTQLLAWTHALTPAGATHPELPQLTFTWGALSSDVNLISADISYERFGPDGKPIRATVNLICHTRTDPPVRTNPTSGGLAGRRSHILVAGENLQHIATANYGRPGAWRALAAANDITDPLALRPGTTIYLPSRTELADADAEPARGNGGPR